MRKEVHSMYRKFNFNKVSPNVRYYFTVVGDMKVNVMDRLTHKPITYLNDFESINHWMDKLNAMSEEEYYKYIFDLGIKPNTNGADSEGWFTGAWIYETDKLLTKLDREIPETSLTSITLEAQYNEYKLSIKKEKWGNDKSNSIRDSIIISNEKTETREEAETETNREVSKAPKGKKLLRKKTSVQTTNEVSNKDCNKANKSDNEVSSKTLQEELDNLTQLKSEGKVTFGEYVKMKRKLIEKYGA